MIVESRIEEVKVYARGATVVRAVEIPATDARAVEIPGLPLALVDASVRVRALEVLGGSLVAGEVRVGLYVKPREQLEPEPDREELRRLERAITAKRRDLEQLDVEMGLLGAIRVPDRPRGEKGKPPPASPLAARVALEALTEEGVSARLAEARRIHEEIAKLEEDAAAVRERFERARRGRRVAPDEMTKTVVVALRREGAPFRRARLTIEYFVPGARWASQYQLRIARGGESATIVLRAVVAQASGEDWRGVKLRLSTAHPMSWTELPKMASIRIGRAQPEPMRLGFRPPPQGAAALFADHDRDRSRMSAPAGSGFLARSFAVAPLAPLVVPALPAPEPEAAYAGEIEMDKEADDDDVARVARGFSPLNTMVVGQSAFGPPPPPPPSAAAPMRGAAVPVAGPSREMAKSSAAPGLAKRRAKPAAPADEALAEEAAAPLPARSQAAFAELRLGAPDSGERGRLHPASTRDGYMELLDRARLVLDFDPLPVVDRAEQRAAAVGSLALPAGTVDPRQAAGQWDYAYSADDRVDVPSDGAFCSVPLGVREAPCALSYVVVPREDQNVFRIAAIENPTRAPLLPGPVEVYVGGEYVLTSTLPSVAPRERFRLGLGVEQAIKCARNTQFREQRSGAAVVAMAELWHEIEIRLANRLQRAIRCEVRERIPQPAKDAEVVVEEAEVTPPWEVWDQRDHGPILAGGRRWQVDVPAGGEEVLRARYVVKIYANNELVGGNRREA